MRFEHQHDHGDGATVDEEEAVHHCGSHAVGHDPHWIQVLKIAPRYPSARLSDVRLVGPFSVELDVERTDGIETLERHNHDAIRLYTEWSHRREGEIVERASLVRLGQRPEPMPCFSVTDVPIGHCGI